MGFPYSEHLISTAFSYHTYRQHIDELLASPAIDETYAKYRKYTENNVRIMNQYDTAIITEPLISALKAAPDTTWLVLTEGWCGDAAFNVPVIAALEKAVPGKIELHCLLRDKNQALMDAHLTDGGRSIPKVIILSKELKELGSWGPRPEPLQELMKQWKNDGLGLNETIQNVQQWYDADATQTLQKELTSVIRSYSIQ